MKNIALILMVVTLVFSASSCKKDKSDDPTYTKSQLIGKWKQTSPASEQGYTDYVTISDTKFKTSSEHNGVEGSYVEFDYTFDGKAISIDFIEGISTKCTITNLTSTTLEYSTSMMGQGLENYKFTKVQ